MTAERWNDAMKEIRPELWSPRVRGIVKGWRKEVDEIMAQAVGVVSPIQNAGQKLTAPMAARIKELHASGISKAELGRMFDVDRQVIRAVVQGKIWKAAP